MLLHGSFGVATVVAVALAVAIVYLLVRRNPYDNNRLTQKASA